MRLRQAVLYTFARQVAVLLLGLVSVSLVSRSLGAEEFGRYSFAIAVVYMANTILSLSLPAVIVHFMEPMRQKGKQGELLGNGLLLLSAGCFLALLCGLLGIHSHYFASKGFDTLGIWVMLVLLALQMLRSFLEAIVLGIRDYGAYNAMQLGIPAITLALLVLFQTAWTKWQHVVLIGAAATGVVIPWYWSVARNRGLTSLTVGCTIRQTFFGYGMQMWMSNLVTVANYRMQYFLIEMLFGAKGLGQYALAVQFSEKLWIPGQAVAAIVFPERSAGPRIDRRKTFRQGLRLIVLNMVLVLMGLLGLYVFFSAFKGAIFGAGFDDVANLVLALGPGMVAWAGVTIIGSELAGRGHSGSNLVASFVALMVGTIGVIWGGFYGILWAALGISSGYICGCAVSLWYFYKHAGA